MAYRRDGRAEARERAGSVAAGGKAKQLHSNTYPFVLFFCHHFCGLSSVKNGHYNGLFLRKRDGIKR